MASIRSEQPRVGTRKLHNDINLQLKSAGIAVGRDWLFSELRSQGLLVMPKKRYSRTTYSNHSYAVAPNRIKQLQITRPNQVFVSDITYISLERGFAYLFLVTDAYSRKIVGYHLSKDLSHYSAKLALYMAVKDLKRTDGIIHHSDRGCQYCCHEFLELLQYYNMISSMTDESHCYQNAIAERVNGILKDEFDCDAVFANFAQARTFVPAKIDIYNNKRTHWSLGLQTPSAVYSKAA